MHSLSSLSRIKIKINLGLRKIYILLEKKNISVNNNVNNPLQRRGKTVGVAKVS